jgi:hypothetical protein
VKAAVEAGLLVSSGFWVRKARAISEAADGQVSATFFPEIAGACLTESSASKTRAASARVCPTRDAASCERFLGYARCMHPATLPPAELLKACSETRTKRSGPGGQHRNKTETAVVLVHRPTGISAEASERRSQAENRQVALDRLRLKLAVEHRGPTDSNGPSQIWRSRTRGRQLVISPSHDDYPALVAEALDQLNVHGFEMPKAAELLGVTATQLLKLFKKHPAAWTALNTLRVRAGLAALK